MIILGLFLVIILIIFTICLPQILYIILVGFVGFVICKTLRRKQMGQMIVVLCVFICLEIICQEVMPTINKVYSSKQELRNSISDIKDNEDNLELNGNRIKQSIEKELDEKTKENTKTSKIWDFLTRYPNEKD